MGAQNALYNWRILLELKRQLGFYIDAPQEEIESDKRRLIRYINLRLAADGLTAAENEGDSEFADVARGLLENHQEKTRLLREHRCPVDQRIEDFLARYCADLNLERPLRLPSPTFALDRHGMARELAVPAEGDKFKSHLVESYRVTNGVLHNPRHDRRTTKGTFHVVEGGLPVPGDKKSVPKHVFAALFERAVQAPDDLLELPYTSNQEEKARTFVSLLLRPKVCPKVPGFIDEKTLEVRFFAPGGLVSNLDFVESIFGNAGDPNLPQNDAGLDVQHWTGHTGCVLLATHLGSVTKKEVGLPHVSDATERQKRDGMCWESETELYNEGTPFKIVCRNDEGVVVTVISDNYFGYCKKEVKSQISYSANLFGLTEEEHAGGAIAYPSYNLGNEVVFKAHARAPRTFSDVVVDYADSIEVHEEGYAVDKQFPELIYVPENARASLGEQAVSWTTAGKERHIPLLPGKIYMGPSGYQVRMEKHPAAPTWRLIGTSGEGTFCHKPCTVSGGGKSEISKSLRDYMHYGPIFVSDVEHDFNKVDEIFNRDYRDRWKPATWQQEVYSQRESRKLLDPKRSLGSVIKLLTPSPDYTDEFNQWLHDTPNHISAIVLIIKRFYKPEWEGDWRSRFHVDIINGEPGYELKFGDRKLVGTYLRVGLLDDGVWRTFKARQDFAAAGKVQTEDDISASVIVPPDRFKNSVDRDVDRSYKFTENCEYRLFQRPDDAIHRGLDKQTEKDLARIGQNFLCNFEPLTLAEVEAMRQYVVDFDAFTPPMQEMLLHAEEKGASYVVSSAEPRKIDGVPTKNPRYLQDRLDLSNPLSSYAAARGARLLRGVPDGKPVYQPVDAVLFGRRNNAPEPERGIRGLAVYGPIHYQEPPEMFMDFMASLTGKSPSTTGFGMEGALTKGPFNSLIPAADLSAAFVSYLLTRLDGFSSAAGAIGPNVQVGHDISLLVPEIWCRLSPEERRAQYLLDEGLLEKVEDYEDENGLVRGARLGYRITYGFVRRFFGRIFDNPDKVFDDAILKPETQDPAAFADGIRYICEAHEAVGKQYLEDGAAKELCPPLRALVDIMAYGEHNGMKESDPEFRALFTREAMLESDWYQMRLEVKRERDEQRAKKTVAYLESFAANNRVGEEMALDRRLSTARAELARVQRDDYMEWLRGTIGADPLRPH